MKPKRTKKPLNWKRIWCDFDSWAEAEEEKNRLNRCPNCRSIPYNVASDWDEQQRAIQRIVEANR